MLYIAMAALSKSERPWIQIAGLGSVAIEPALSPEPLARDASALGQRREFRPDNVRVDRGLADPCSVPAVASRDHILAANEFRIIADPVGDDLGMFDEVRLRFEDTWDQDFAVRKLCRFEHRIFVRMA